MYNPYPDLSSFISGMGYTLMKGAAAMTKNVKYNTHIYELNEWEIVENSFSIEDNYRDETVFALGNGYIGIRGNFEEGYSGPAGTSFEGTFLNGVYESDEIKYGEIAYGYPEKSQTMVNVANCKKIKLFLEDEEFDLLKGSVLNYRRSLNMKEGFLKRTVRWVSPKGREAIIDIERLVSLANKNLAAISYCIAPVNFSGSIRLISGIEGRVSNSAEGNDPRVGSGLNEDALSLVGSLIEGEQCALIQKTKNTEINIVSTVKNSIETECGYLLEKVNCGSSIEIIYTIDAEKGKTIKLNKFISYFASRGNTDILLTKAFDTVEAGEKAGFAALKEEQKKYLEDFWHRADVRIKGDLALQQAVRFNLYHVLQAAGRDGRTNICAKGLTGEGYEGHYFWDTEMYVIPFFLYSRPDISRKLLEYRYNTLDKARERARELSHNKGALFPWRTIDGAECSAYFPASTAQYHINADIAHAIKKYMEATQDEEFLLHYGAEIIFETARLWADLGFFNGEKGGKFCINCVTGPDEYTAIVNNNFYTNLMAEENLRYAYDTALWMKEEHTEDYYRLAYRIGLQQEELELWRQIADNMYIPYSEKFGIHPQDDSFLEKKMWDFENTPKENYPLLLHYHPLVIYRHQVCKQADVVLALFIQSHRFSREQKKRDYDYYERITTHDSSLSTCIFSIVANDIGYREKAYDYFIRTVRMDLDDYQGNTKHGVHTANMAGSYLCIVNGFAGMRVNDGAISFDPYINPVWEEYSFKISYRGRLIKLTISRRGTVYELMEGEELDIVHKGKSYILKDKLVLE